ncbi:hypothetical protein [Haliea sp.]|uniref:hypothetical protein n=1 Tax=Haliea sp. TaxID=1932666 RepID=UPI00257B3E12|nr:hypothetical protein [Haliea sp.]
MKDKFHSLPTQSSDGRRAMNIPEFLQWIRLRAWRNVVAKHTAQIIFAISAFLIGTIGAVVSYENAYLEVPQYEDLIVTEGTIVGMGIARRSHEYLEILDSSTGEHIFFPSKFAGLGLGGHRINQLRQLKGGTARILWQKSWSPLRQKVLWDIEAGGKVLMSYETQRRNRPRSEKFSKKILAFSLGFIAFSMAWYAILMYSSRGIEGDKS